MKRLIDQEYFFMCYLTELAKAAKEQERYLKSADGLDHRTRIYSMGASFLEGEFWKLITPDNLFAWIRPSAEECVARHMIYERRIPMLDKKYTEFERAAIKYALHGVLSLGNRVLILVVPNRKFIRTMFGYGNIMFISGKNLEVFLGSVGYGDSKNVQHRESPKDVNNLSWLTDDSKIARSHETFQFEYDKSSFKTGPGRTPQLKRKYGDFLWFLQGGRCELCGDALDGRAQVDHVYPVSRSGVSTIINLELLHGSCNRLKLDKLVRNGIDVESRREIFTKVDLNLKLHVPPRNPWLMLADRRNGEPPFFPILFV